MAVVVLAHRGLGACLSKVFERRRLVLLSVLASQVPLRCTRLRRQTGRLLRLDPLRCFWSWVSRGRLVFQSAVATKPVSYLFAKNGARAQRGGYAGGRVDHASPRRDGDRDFQHRFFRPAVVVNAGDDAAG